MATVDGLLDQMKSAVDGADQELGMLSPRIHSQERIEARTAEILAELQERVEGLRSQALVLLDEQRRAADLEYHRATQPVFSADQWSEAAARSDFVRADLAGLSPSDLVDYHRLVADAGDPVHSWLVVRLGAERLDALENDPAVGPGDIARARVASNEMFRAAYGSAYDEHKERKAELVRNQQEIERPMTPPELESYRRRIGDAYGVEAALVPDPA